MSDHDDLLARVAVMLGTYERRGHTNVPGTVTLLRDLAAALRAVTAERDALRQVVRRYHTGWVLLGGLDGPEWHSDPRHDSDEPGEFQPVAEPATQDEADALRRALEDTL